MKSNFLKLLTLASLSSCAFFSSASEQNSTVNVTYDAFGQVVLTSFDPKITSADSSDAVDTLFYEFDPYYKQGISMEADKLIEVLSSLQGKANFVLRRTPKHHDLEVSGKTAQDYMNEKGYEVCFINKLSEAYLMNQCMDSWHLLLEDVSTEDRNEYILKPIEQYFPNAQVWQQGDIQVSYDDLGQVELTSFDTFLNAKQVMRRDISLLFKKVTDFYEIAQPSTEETVKALAEMIKSIKGKVNFEFSRSEHRAFAGHSSKVEIQESIEKHGYTLAITGVGQRFEIGRFGFSSSGFFNQEMSIAERNKFVLAILKELQEQ